MDVIGLEFKVFISTLDTDPTWVEWHGLEFGNTPKRSVLGSVY